MLVVVNFAEENAEVEVCIPVHAFEFLGLPEDNYLATDLLTDEQQLVRLAKDKTFKMRLRGWGARVWKITLGKCVV